MPSLCSESPTHLAVIAAAMRGTMYCRPPVNSNIITTKDTAQHKCLKLCTNPLNSWPHGVSYGKTLYFKIFSACHYSIISKCSKADTRVYQKNSTDNKTCKRQTGHSGDTSEGSTGADHCVQTGSDTRMSTVAHFLENVVVLIRATNTQTRTVS